MDFKQFDKSSHVPPLLVRLYDSHKLYGLVKDEKPLARAELTRAVTDLFERELTVKEQELLADVLIGLMRQAESDLRQALAERLARLDNVPLRLVLHLANDDISVAAPVLAKSIVLSDMDLIYIIKSQGPEYWQAIAAREHMSNEVIDILADTKDVGTAIALSQNDRIHLTLHALTVLTEVAKGNEAVARPLLMRPEIPENLARQLYDCVGKELKEFINTFLTDTDADIDADIETEAVVDDLILEFCEPEKISEFMPTEKQLSDAEKHALLNHLNMEMMMETLSKGDIPNFIAMFGTYTGISAKKVHDFLKQSCPKGMAIACRAFRVQKNEFTKIYLLTHRMRSKDRMVNQKDMMDVLKYFDKIRPEAAMRIVNRTAH